MSNAIRNSVHPTVVLAKEEVGSQKSTRFSRVLALSLGVLTLAGASQAIAADSSGSTVSISFQNDELPASDLVTTQGGPARILTPEEAWQLKKAGTDLSTLDPDSTTDVWKGIPTIADDAADAALPIQAGEQVDYVGVISSSDGRFRFNVQTKSANQLTLMMSRELHTFLLRKELLRSLGYQIPAMKYLPKVTVRFPDVLTKSFFIKTQLPAAAYGAPNRWQVSPESDTSLDVTFQDVVALDATPLYYNLALGPPIELSPGTTNIRPLGPRILRSLAISLGLVSVPETVNQLDWAAGRVDNGYFTFDVMDQANFACTLDDALWITRRIAALKRPDFERIVARAYLPGPVGKVVLEKIISRRNSLVTVFGLKDGQLPIDAEITDLPGLDKGKLVQQEWPGYASRFSYGDPESPLRDLKYYVISQLQSNAMQNLVKQFNKRLPMLKTTSGLSKQFEDMVSDALYDNVKSGKAQAVRLMVAPTASAGVDLSRNIIIGNYLGTNNLLQLVDTFGFHASAGFVINVTGMPIGTRLGGGVSGSISFNLSHVKPLATLKSAVTEPIKNEYVPWVSGKAASIFRVITEEEKKKHQDPEELKKAISEDLDQLRNYLGVGESLILSQTLSGSAGVSASIQGPGRISPAATLQFGSSDVVISRLHITRKDANTIMVFKDNGELNSLSVSFYFTVFKPAHLPVLYLGAKSVNGQGHSKIFTVNIDPNPKTNPDIFSNANALSHALGSGSIEVLESLQKPAKLDVNFRDDSGTFQFFHFLSRTLKTNAKVHVELPTGAKGDFISLSDGEQEGNHYQALANQVATFLMERLLRTGDVSINTGARPDPGQSYLGHSETRTAEFQGRSMGTYLSQPFVSVEYRWRGWEKPADKTVEHVRHLSQKYGFKVYPDNFLGDTKSIQLYEILFTIRLYENALKKLMSMTPSEEGALEVKYGRANRCDGYNQLDFPWDIKFDPTPDQKEACAALESFKKGFETYRDGISKADQYAGVVFAIASGLEKFADFNDFKKAVGGEQNFFIDSVISGFRNGSENLSKPIRSNTLGKVDPDNPTGVLDTVQKILGIENGEFQMQWMRDTL